MAYRPNTREFWLKVADYECQYHYYTEKLGWVICAEIANHVHHIKGERETLLGGGDPERNVGLPLCQNHHVRFTGDTLGEHGSSFHPDMGIAYTHYRSWKQKALHMNHISGKKNIDYSTSPFADAARDHEEMIKNGERYINGDDSTDEFYIQHMRTLAVKYLAEHPEERKPNTKHHLLYDSKKKKRWFNT